MTDRLGRALECIEAHLFEPMTVAEIAAAAGLSVWHFSRLFSAGAGMGVMTHVRRRRLAAAGRRLAEDPKARLIELAFDCGFESQEAFTRAFKRAAGMTPGRFRREKPDWKGWRPMAGANIRPEIEDLGVKQRPAFTVMGVSTRMGEGEEAKIPTMWPRLFRILPSAAERGSEAYGVLWSDGGPGEAMNYMAGVQKTGLVPEGLTTRDVPAQTYLVFRQTLDGGELHPQMQAGARKIWGELVPASGRRLARGPDLEVYGADFDPARKGATVEIWVPVEA